ncbi:O-antigen ligase family protein [Croceibacterium ferulae]|uniref:O-antigen ligase family protein n=1 Tax=Croceibacterium ferulae TaxID=1854641 RepID=UPI000EB38EE9|nr:O-antigen ligase family protein [Croceibacterium ferulae]
MSIVKTLLGRNGRNQSSGRRHAGSLLLGSVRKIGWNEVYLGTFVLLLVALCYKLVVTWTLAFIILAGGCWSGRRYITKINASLVVGLLYVADATTTAFLVSTSAGIYRTAQFLLIAGSLVGIYAYSFQMKSEDALRVVKVVAAASCLIFAHLIIHHVMMGRYITWKYLYDTKLVISLTVFVAFALRDQIVKYIPFLVVLAILIVLVIMSAERKALLLMAVLLVFSNMAVSTRLLLCIVGPVLLVTIAILGLDGGYLYGKYQASSANYTELSDRYFTTVHNIADYSNIIREFVNRRAWQLFQENPWFGVGATGYWDWATTAYGRGSGLAMNVHGEVHRIPAEGGIVGLTIAAVYIVTIAWRTGHFAFLRRARTGSSLERTPFYLLLYVMCYAYAEAIDSAMLVLIGLAGVVSARLPSPTINVFLKRRPPSERRLTIPAIAHRSQPTFLRRLVRR